ncbi:MAG: hypothetical protein IPI67_33285 [Myxococcales bacterium]|nr:hypothetical protein [Myxococcales bacterium]
MAQKLREAKLGLGRRRIPLFVMCGVAAIACSCVERDGARISSEPDLAGALGAYRNEYTAREGQTRRALEALRGMVDKKTPLAALPTLRTSDPRVILVALAGELAGAGWVQG